MVLGKTLLIIAGLAFCAWSWVTVERRLALARPKRQEWLGALLMPAIIMILALTANALAFLSEAMLTQEMEWMDGARGVEPPSWWEMFRTQLSVVGGTCMLMWMVRSALTRDEIYEGEHPRVAGVIAQKHMIQNLVIRHWLAVIGLGVVFGVASGPGIVMLLAIELSIMWVGAHFGLKFFRHRLIDEDAAEETSESVTVNTIEDDYNRAA